MEKKKQEELLLEAKNFFESQKKEIGKAIRTEERAIQINFLDVAQISKDLADSIEQAPEETIAILENAFSEMGLGSKDTRVRFRELPQSLKSKIREIRAKHLDQLIWVEGIIRQASDVRPQVVNAKFECPNCGAILSVLQIDRKFREPSRCSCSWKGTFKLLSKEMVDTQRLVVEESPDMLEGGEQPRRINVFLKEDLVDPRMEERTTPGSKVKIFSILKEVPVPLQTGAISTRFDIALEANNIIPLEETFEDLEISDEEIKEIKEIAADPNLNKRLTESIAPSIYGFEKIKEAVLLQMFGGIKKKKSDGGSTRGDIHTLLVGDPGVAKSVLLKFISQIAPKGRYVSGKAASAAGMCVAPKSLLMTNPGGMSTIQEVTEQRLPSNTEEYRPGVWKKDDIKDINIQSLSKELKIQSKNPKSVWKLKAPKKVYEIELSSGKQIEITGNTSLYSIKDGNPFWKKSSEVKLGDYIATPRKLIGGNKKDIFIVDLIKSNPVIHDIKPFVKEIINKLKDKYGDIRKASKELNIRENQLYHHWVNEQARGNIKIKNLKKIAESVNVSWKDKIKTISLYNGKKHKLPQLLDKDLLYLAGLISGDGDIRTMKSKSYSIRFSNTNDSLHKIFKETIENKFNLKCDLQKGNEQRPTSIRFHSKILGEILQTLGIPLSPKSNRMFMSETLLHTSNELLSNYIAGLYDTDGSVYHREKVGSDCIDFNTCSEKLAKQLQLSLLRYEIHSRLRCREPTKGKIKGKHKIWILEIRNTEEIRKFAENIQLRHPKKIEKLNKILEKNKRPHTNIDSIPISNLLKEILQKNNISLKKVGWHENISRTGLQRILSKISINGDEMNKLRKLADSDIFWEKVKRISQKTPDYEYVYDLTVKDSHNFVVDGILVHNTAAVVKDEFLKGWSLEAGAMVLSNRGAVCIDEIEKMNEQDRSAMHEALEQQTVTISKANIHATLRAETTVLAAGNPKLGRFDPYTPIPQQIDISPALLSRFDVIFVIRDLPNRLQDEAVANHVLEEHKQEVIRETIDPKLLRKYISYAKKMCVPKLTDEAINEIKEFYVKLRNQSTRADSEVKPIAITARQLEGIIRLSEACAKIRLGNKVIKEDALRAIDLLKMSLSQVGYDEETKTFDIDRVTTGITSSKRGKILTIREIIHQLESKLGKLIPLEELEKEVDDKVSGPELEDALNQLVKYGDIFRPKKGYIQRM